MDFNSLPQEVLSQIFASLPINDKKNIRLVCKRWNSSCNCPNILNNEKFCFWGDSNSIGLICSFLLNCKQLRSTIEFQGLCLDRFSDVSNIWQLIGKNVHSLSLLECEISKETTANIFLHCPNMRSFKLTNQLLLYKSLCLFDHYFFSPQTLDELIKLNVQRPKMTSFELYIGGLEVPEKVLQKIFKIFPHIQNFGMGFVSYFDFPDRIYFDYSHNTICNFINPTFIKELTINLPSDGLLLRKLANTPQLRLKKLETICMELRKAPFSALDDINYFLCSDQPELEILKINLEGLWGSNSEIKELLLKILSNFHLLKEFSFVSKLNLTKNDFSQILQMVLKSKLECFVFKFVVTRGSDICNNQLSDDLPASFTNKILHTLILKTPRILSVIPEDFCLPFLRYLCNLRYLEMNGASDKILQTICHYQIHLETLILKKIPYYTTAFGFGCISDQNSHLPANEKVVCYPISRLSKLRHLELEGQLKDSYLGKILLQLHFPKLVYLRLEFWGFGGKRKMNLNSLCTTTPSVEILVVEMPSYSYSYRPTSWSFCQHMPQLKCLFYQDSHKTTDNGTLTVVQLFTSQSSLKYAVSSINIDNTVNFLYPTTKSLSIIKFDKLYFN